MNEVEIITLDEHNLEKVQLFCGHSPTYRVGYIAKKQWLQKRLSEGMRYKLLTVNGHNAGMIEYIPAEYGWRGVEAKGYFLIHCFWVIGRNRKHGFGRLLLENCLKDTKDSNGVVVVSSRTHWLPTRKIFLKNGFRVIEENPPFELLVRQFKPDAPLPRFKQVEPELPEGLALYFSDQCPYMQNMPAIVEQVGVQLEIPVKIIMINKSMQVQNSPCPYGVLGIYYNNKLVDYRPTGTKKLLENLQSRLNDPGKEKA
jgi:GNAT superfamily N-acetyltransferase